MSWAMVGIAGVSAIGGLFGNKSAKKLQKQSIQLQRDKLNFDQKRYDDYQKQYAGINDLVISEAQQGVTADLGRASSEASADTATAFKNAQTALDNQNQRMGINPNSGRADSNNRQLALSQAIATAGNVTNSRNNERKTASDQTWNRRYAVYGSGINLVNNAANSVNNSTNALAETYNSQAASEGAAANQALGLGASLGIQALSNYMTPKTTTIPVNQIDSTTKGLKLNGTDVSSGIIYDNISSVQPKSNTNSTFLG